MNSTTEKPDIHMKLMKKYKEAPTWWYLTLFAIVSNPTLPFRQHRQPSSSAPSGRSRSRCPPFGPPSRETRCASCAGITTGADHAAGRRRIAAARTRTDRVERPVRERAPWPSQHESPSSESSVFSASSRSGRRSSRNSTSSGCCIGCSRSHVS